MEIHQLRAFVAVAESGGFAPAAAALDIAPSSITRAIASLEATLGVRLFQRTTRSVALTETGEQFLHRIQPALEEINAAADQLSDDKTAVSGYLRVAASVSFGQCVLAPNLARFNRLYPDIEIELLLSDAVTDLIGERIDIAIRHGALTDSSLIAQRLCSVRYRLVASQSYLENSKRISRPQDIANHICLTFPYPSFRSSWWFTRGDKSLEVPLKPRARISNAVALTEAVKSGMGIALLPDWLVDKSISDGELTHLLRGWNASGEPDNPDATLWAVMPSRKFVPKKTEVFAQFLRSIDF